MKVMHDKRYKCIGAGAQEQPQNDVSNDTKEWFLRYYLPTLQHKKLQWNALLAKLKAQSFNRIQQNSGYQHFLSLLRGGTAQLTSEDKKHDFQLDEAVEVVKDMIIESKHKT